MGRLKNGAGLGKARVGDPLLSCGKCHSENLSVAGVIS